MSWSSQYPSAYPLNDVDILASNFCMNFPGFTLCARPCDEPFQLLPCRVRSSLVEIIQKLVTAGEMVATSQL